MLRNLIVGAVAATGAFAIAASAQAGDVLISADHLASYNYTTVLSGTVDGQAFNLNVYESPDILTASFDDGATYKQLLVFCVDIFHFFDPANTPPITYETGLLTRDSSPALTPLSALVSGEIGYLASLYDTNMDAASLAGLQGAIWLTEYNSLPGNSLTLTGGATSRVADFMTMGATWATTKGAGATFANAIYTKPGQSQGQTQGFVIAGEVPEPASWALMIGGFGMAGVMLRRRRSVAATA